MAKQKPKINIMNTANTQKYDIDTKTAKGYDIDTKTTKGYDIDTKTTKGYDIDAKTTKGYDIDTKTTKGYDIDTKTTKGYDIDAKTAKGYDIDTKTAKGYDIDTKTSKEYKCKKCHKEFKIKHYYIKHLAQCCSEDNATDAQLSAKDKRIKELKNKQYNDFSHMTAEEEAIYKQDQVELLELQEEYRMDLRRKRLAARIKANESRPVSEIIAENKRMKEAERIERERIEKLTPAMLDKQQRLAQIAIEKRKSKEADDEAQEDAEDDYKKGLENGRKCPRCDAVFKSDNTFKNHIFKTCKNIYNDKNVSKQIDELTKNICNNNTYTTTKTTINGKNISELVKNCNFDILSNMGNIANLGTNTHTRQTVNQLNANSVKIVPPSQDDLDMVVKYIYDKFIKEFEEYKQEKIEGYRRDMLERQRIYLEEKERQEKEEEMKRLEDERLEQEKIQKERDADLAKLQKDKKKINKPRGKTRV
jgi:biotin operon repressor